MPNPPQKPSHASDFYTYVPQAAQAAMSRQMQQASVPAHLRQYVGNDKPAFIPPAVQRELTAHMEKVMPQHLKQYAGAYVEQNIMPRPGNVGVRPAAPHPQIPDQRNLSHSGNIAAEQADATTYLNMFQADQSAQPSTVPPQPTPSLPNPNPDHPDYGFIMEPPKPPRRNLFNGGGQNSMLMRIALIGGGLVVLLVLFTVVRSALSGGSDYRQAMLGVAQDQYALQHYAAQGVQNANASDVKNFAVTAQASLSSEEGQIISYLANNHYKVGAKLLPLKVDKTVDTQLTTSVSASNFDSTFTGVMKDKLTTYQHDLQQAYTQVTGTKGRTLLSDDYKAAQLLLQQLGS
jgi:hypothetical protein